MVLGQLVLGLASIFGAVFSVATLVLFARVLFSWLRPNPPAGFIRTVVQGVYDVTDPVLDWLRVTFPFLQVGAFDLTPLVAFFGLSLLRNVVVGGLVAWGNGLLI